MEKIEKGSKFIMARSAQTARKGKQKKKIVEHNQDGDPPAKKQKKEESVEKPEESSSSSGTQSQPKKDFNFKICSWNVAGIRACLKKNMLDYLMKEDADVICLQETKAEEVDLPKELESMKNGNSLFGKKENSYHMYWSSAKQKGYSGVSLWSKKKPEKVTYGIGVEEHDEEGRLITAEFPKFYLVTSYVPNSGKKLVRLDYRRTWNNALKDYLNKLEESKPVIFCGDLNVAHNEIDIANPKANKRNAGFTIEEREDFSALLEEGYFDSFRHLYPDKADTYTYWTYMANARAKNVGWRLDYFVMSEKLKDNLCDSEMRSDVMGSDHCPIVLTLSV